MRFDTDKAESSVKFKEGERYVLVVDSAEEDQASTGTPFLKLNLKTESGETAYDHKIYNTPKAMFRAVAWFKAMGFNTDGPVDVDPSSLAGIKLSAVCVVEKYNTDEPNGGTKEHAITKWDKPERVGVGSAAPRKPAAKQEPTNEDVPF